MRRKASPTLLMPRISHNLNRLSIHKDQVIQAIHPTPSLKEIQYIRVIPAIKHTPDTHILNIPAITFIPILCSPNPNAIPTYSRLASPPSLDRAWYCWQELSAH